MPQFLDEEQASLIKKKDVLVVKREVIQYITIQNKEKQFSKVLLKTIAVKKKTSFF